MMVEGPLLVTSLWAMRLEHEFGVNNGCMQLTLPNIGLCTAYMCTQQRQSCTRSSCKCPCQTAKTSTTQRVHREAASRQS